MIIIAVILVMVLLCLGVDLIKLQWLRGAAHVALLLVGLVAVFRFGNSIGEKTAHAYDAREVQELIEIVQDSSKTNSVEELRGKLQILKDQVPDAIINNDRGPLLKTLKVD